MLVGKVFQDDDTYTNAVSFTIKKSLVLSFNSNGVDIVFLYDDRLVKGLIRNCYTYNDRLADSINCKNSVPLWISYQYLSWDSGPISWVQPLMLDDVWKEQLDAFLWFDRFGNAFIDVFPKGSCSVFDGRK